MKQFRITVPATLDGLGPGSGIVGLALALTDTVNVELDPESEEICGPERMCQAYRSWRQQPLPGARFTLEPGIPEGHGLGDTTARIVAGLAAAVAATDTKDAGQEVFRLALSLGASPGQLAACLMGGLTTALPQADSLAGIHVADHLSMGVALFLPDVPSVLTPAPQDPARLTYLLTSLIWGRWDWIAPAMRPESLPESIEHVLAAAGDAGAYGATVSGSALCALTPHGQGEDVARAMEEQASSEGLAGRALATRVREAGVEIVKQNPPEASDT